MKNNEKDIAQAMEIIRCHARDVHLGMCLLKMAAPILMY